MRVEVFASQDEYSQEDLTQWGALVVHVASVVGPARFCYVPKMQRMLDVFGPDVIHSAAVWTYPAAVVNRLHRSRGTPYVLSPRGTLDSWALANSKWKKRIALRLFQQEHFESAACIHALNEGEARSIRAFGLKNPICVIPNGVEIPKGNAEDRMSNAEKAKESELGDLRCQVLTEGRKVLLYLGRLHPKKGLVNLLRAWSETLKNRNTASPSDWLLAIAGWDEGGHEAQLKELATELEIRWTNCQENSPTGSPTHRLTDPPASLVFLGPQFGKAKEALYETCDAFILPSFSEGLPMVALEAWAHRKPVLMTPQCNIPEGFSAGAAIRAEPNPESIFKGLNSLFECSGADLASMGARGHTLVERRFAWPVIAREMKTVYDWVLGGGSVPETVWK